MKIRSNKDLKGFMRLIAIIQLIELLSIQRENSIKWKEEIKLFNKIGIWLFLMFFFSSIL